MRQTQSVYEAANALSLGCDFRGAAIRAAPKDGNFVIAGWLAQIVSRALFQSVRRKSQD